MRKKIPTWYAADTNSGKRDTVIAPFFDIPIETLTSTARIAALSKAVVVPTYFYRRDDNKGYNIVLGAPLENFPTKDAIADAHRVNQALEIGIRKMPEQYFWQYRRFKLPSHLADPYRL